MQSWTYPWSVSRLVRLCQTWSFDSDVRELPDDDHTGEPRCAKAFRRIQGALREHEEAQGVDYRGTWRDDRMMGFHISDVAMILDEYRRLTVFEDRVITAMGPPLV